MQQSDGIRDILVSKRKKQSHSVLAGKHDPKVNDGRRIPFVEKPISLSDEKKQYLDKLERTHKRKENNVTVRAALVVTDLGVIGWLVHEQGQQQMFLLSHEKFVEDYTTLDNTPIKRPDRATRRNLIRDKLNE